MKRWFITIAGLVQIWLLPQAGHAYTVSVNDPKMQIYCLPDETLRLKADCNTDYTVTAQFVEMDYKMVSRVTGDPRDSDDHATVDIRPPTSPGLHMVRIGYALANGETVWLPSYTLHVLTKSPLGITKIDHVTIHDVPMDFTMMPADDFKPCRAEVYIDGTQVPCSNNHAVLPLNWAAPGPHALRIDLYDAEGGRLEYDDTISVQDAIHINPPKVFETSTSSDRLKISVDLVNGLDTPSVRIKLWADGDDPGDPKHTDEHVIARLTKAPYETSLDLSQYPSGKYYIQAIADGPDRLRGTGGIAINLVNDHLDLLDQIDALRSKIRTMDEEIEDTYTKYMAESDTVTYTRSILSTHIITSDSFVDEGSLSYLDTVTVPGHKSDLLSECQRLILDRAQIRLTLAKATIRAGNIAEGRSLLAQIVKEIGSGNEVSDEAQNELMQLK